jgi:hypothetical protein
VNALVFHVAAQCGKGASPTPRLLSTRIIDNQTDSITEGPERQQDIERCMYRIPPRMSEYTEATVRITFTTPKTSTAMPMAAKALLYHTRHSAGFVQ